MSMNYFNVLVKLMHYLALYLIATKLYNSTIPLGNRTVSPGDVVFYKKK